MTKPLTAASYETSSSASNVSKFIRFLSLGGLAALVNILSRYLLTPVVGFEPSVLLAYLIGMATAYFLFKLYVFDRSGRSFHSEAYRFVLVNIVGITLVWIVTVGLARHVFPVVGMRWHAEDLAHIIGACVPAISSYLGHSKYTFGR